MPRQTYSLTGEQESLAVPKNDLNLFPLLPKKFAHQFPALIGQEAALNIDLMIEQLVAKNIDDRSAGPGLGIGSSKEYLTDP